jgi:dTDP-4-dehydrorhamnose reductase
VKLLVVGSNGQLGWEILKASKDRGLECEGLDRPRLDITDRSAVERTVGRGSFSLIVNAAAYTAVDQAEVERDEAFAANAGAPGDLAFVCAKHHVPLIHLSTDYVFDGNKKSPYNESDPVCPTGTYGESKAAGEKAVREALETCIILRTSWLYSSHGDNFVKTILRSASEREELRVVADQYGCPTYAADLAAAILDLAKQISRRGSVQWGVYHYCGHGVTTWHGFARQICQLAREHRALRVKRVEAVSTAEYPTPARRPQYSALDCSKIRSVFGIRTRPWQESLAEMLAGLFKSPPPLFPLP